MLRFLVQVMTEGQKDMKQLHWNDIVSELNRDQ